MLAMRERHSVNHNQGAVMSDRNWTEGWDRAQAVLILRIIAHENGSVTYPGSGCTPSAFERLEEMGFNKDDLNLHLGEILEQAYRLASSGKRDILTEVLETLWPQFPPWQENASFRSVDLRDLLRKKGFSTYYISLYYDELYRRAVNKANEEADIAAYIRRHQMDPLGPDEPDRHGMVTSLRRR